MGMTDFDTALEQFQSELGIPDSAARARIYRRVEELVAKQERRSRTQRLRTFAIALAATLVLGTSLALAGVGDDVFQLLGVEQQPNTPVPALDGRQPRYLLGDHLFGAPTGPQQLGEPTSGETAWSDAVPSSDGTTFVYEAENRGGPGRALRIHNLTSGADRELAADAFAPAWSAAGLLAYGKTVERKTSGGDIGAVFPDRVEVQSSPTATPAQWIETPGNYVPVAWANHTLLVEQLGNDGNASLLAVDGPQQIQQLASGWLDALSPDGNLAVISTGALDGRQTGPIIQLIDTATGDVRASLDLRQTSTGSLSGNELAATGPGDWIDNRVIVPAGIGMLELTVEDNTLSIAKVLHFTGDPGLAGAEYHEARFLDANDDLIETKADVLPPDTRDGQSVQSILVCSLTQQTCARGSNAGTPHHWLGLIANPSRPNP